MHSENRKVTNDLKIGSLIKDNGKIGIITNVIEQGKWTEGGLFTFTKNFEINYADGQTTVMNEYSMERLIGSKTIVVLVY